MQVTKVILMHTMPKNKDKEKITTKERLTRAARKFRKEVKQHTITSWMAALGLILALSWNSVFQSLFKTLTDSLFKNAPEFLAPALSAALITILVVIAIILLNKWANKEQ